ncbi:hypothetical protein HYFRA_00006097 [Hymenoscyphus fraxineus]|uniref:Uncharacterized protein n=1 Tax=Hymenoscyphus fraxineus TaxID=746836 RepID=A0A9N9LBJ8_9HELO|nr:hypothetical protein HYFRA_00006097 [Hymenoscyphus fraxineus]
MPRKLPWQNTPTVASRGQNRTATATTSASAVKRQKRQKTESEGDSDAVKSPSGRNAHKNNIPRAASTSPPPEPPPEKFMRDGMENDDKYRMVEDEFLTVAHQFTVHLHAAEYKRQQGLVKARNADAINSISRPVTGKMTDNVKRKIERDNRSKAQRNALETVVGKKSKEADSDDSNDEVLPYFGTTLHGLMDSPRKKASSLLKLKNGPINATTRAAAGFQKPGTHISTATPVYSPSRSKFIKPDPDVRPVPTMDDTETASDDDDLDAPIMAPKFTAVIKEETTSSFGGDSFVTKAPRDSTGASNVTKRSSITTTPKVATATITETPVKDSARLSRRGYARLRKAKLALDQPKNKQLDVIPTFL